MTVKQTRCPFCHSAFYITALQLNAYRGQARCGQCHQIFDATTNLVLPASDAEPVTDLANSPAPSASHPAQIQPETQTRHPVAVAPSEDSQLLDASLSKPQPSDSALFSDVSGVDDEKAAVSTAPSMTSASAPTVNANVSKLESQSEPELFSDDSGLFDDEPVVASNEKNALILDDVFNPQFLDNTFEDIDVLKQQELNDVEKLHAAADDSWINELLEDDKKTSASSQVSTAKVSSTVNNTTTYVPLPSNLVQRPPVDHDEDLLSFLNRTGAVSTPSISTKAAASAAPRPASHRILKPTTVSYNPAYFVGWSVMSLLMLGLLLAQYVYFNFERLAMDQKTSAYIVTLCKVSGCQIPYMNEDELRIKNLKLTANNRQGETTFRGQLSNTATLSQPFPALQLTLEENGKTVASQIIQPRQYLPENMKMLTRLATKTPYPIEFTIKTRRSEIESYTLKPQYQ